ncbi:MAG: hypothetical protein LBV41_10920 [Cytophagaceae bacterium]|jgi:hypothetical protein|nr:hypothetical protein [Cytophagaceae bacterium]
MKKITILLLSIALMQPVAAQDGNAIRKRYSIDLQLAQHAGLNRWSNASYVNSGLPAAVITELRGVLNLSFNIPHAGMFMDMGVGIMPAPAMRTLNMEQMPVPYVGTRYYLRETVSSSGDGTAGARFKMTAGMFGKIPTNNSNLTVMPYLGIGFMTMPQRSYDVMLKEHGSNMQYSATYIWNCKHYNGYDSQRVAPGYLTGRLNFRYTLSPKSDLLLGLEYMRFFDTPGFYGKYTNTFNANIEKDFSVTGNRVNMLGISLGISFM